MEVIIKTSAKAYTITVKDDKLYIDDEVYEPKPTQDEHKPTHIHTLIDGIKTCRLESTGNFDSINDEPAYVDKLVQQWHKDGKLHRDNGPAIINRLSPQAAPYYIAQYINGVKISDVFLGY